MSRGRWRLVLADVSGAGVLGYDGERVQCHVCSRWFRNLIPHVGPAHGLDAAQYRREFELARSNPLMANDVSLKLAAAANHQMAQGRSGFGRRALAAVSGEVVPPPEAHAGSVEATRRWGRERSARFMANHRAVSGPIKADAINQALVSIGLPAAERALSQALARVGFSIVLRRLR